MASKIIVNLDTSKENYIFAKCKQNDDLTLEAFIYENGEPLDLTNKEITIQALKADNTYIIQNTDITKSNNNFTANLVKDFSRVTGTTKIEIVLTESSKQNTTFSFCLEVVGSVIRGAVQSSNTVTILEELDNKIVEAGQVRDETEQLITSGGAATTGDIKKVNESLEQKASFEQVNYINTLLPSKRDKSVVLGANDIQDLNINNFDEETRAILQGLESGSVNAVLGLKNVETNNIDDGAVNSLNTYLFEGSVLKDLITVDFLNMKITIKSNLYIFADWISYKATSSDIEITIPTAISGRVHLLLYDRNTSVIRLIPNNELPTKYDILICYLYQNIVYGKNSRFINVISNEILRINTIDYVINNVINDPFKNVKIKFIGDSITAGVGATGYGLTETPIGTTGKFVPKQDSLCWANKLGRKLENLYNKNTFILPSEIKDTVTSQLFTDKFSFLRMYKYYNTTIQGQEIFNYTFNGDMINLYFTKQAGSAIVGIYIDNVKIAEVDLYSSSTEYSFKYSINNLSNTTHTLSVKYLRKNVSSSSNRIYLEGLEIPKTVTCVNWGISGSTTENIATWINQLVEENDDIVILQIGTNYRVFNDISITLNNLRIIIDYLKNNKKELILSCSLPSGETNSNLYNTKMADIMSAINKIANENGITFINHYNYFSMLCKEKGVSIEEYLNDGLHPNDKGYDLMYANCCEVLELPII